MIEAYPPSVRTGEMIEASVNLVESVMSLIRKDGATVSQSLKRLGHAQNCKAELQYLAFALIVVEAHVAALKASLAIIEAGEKLPSELDENNS